MHDEMSEPAGAATATNGTASHDHGHSRKSHKEERPHRVPFNAIEIDRDFNVRTQYDNKEIQDLAESISHVGLKTPLTITDGGKTKGKPYRLISGFRRSMALSLLKWGSKDVPVVFEEFADAGKKFLSNLAENTAREDVHSFDQAKRYFELETGIEHDGETVKLTRKEIAQATSLSLAHIGNLVRSYKHLSDDSKKAWRKLDLPLSFVFQLARTEDGKPISDEQQEEELSEKLAQMEAEAAAGGKKRRKKGKDDEGDEDGDSDGASKATMKDLRDRIEYLQGVLEEGGIRGMEKAYAEGKLQGLRFAVGEIKARGLASKYEG